MVTTLHGCGFNGFQQISGLSGVSLEGWTTSETEIKTRQSLESALPTPVKVLQLHDRVQVEKILFTWSRTAAILSKDGDTLSIITGDQGKASQTILQEHSQVLCATELYFLLRENGAGSEFELDCLRDGDAQSQRYFISENNDCKQTAPVDLHASHTDVFYSRGAHEFGKLQLQQSHNVVQLCPLPISLKIAKISCGKEHVLFLSSFGCVYSCGLGSRGQLGHNDVEMEVQPKLIEALEGVPMVEIQAGGWHSLSVSECGDVYTWGWNESGQLGLASRSGIITEPTCVELPQEAQVEAVACGSRHTLLMTDCGAVFASGWNAYGQLGLLHFRNQFTFVRVVALVSQCSRIYAGHWCSLFLCSE